MRYSRYQNQPFFVLGFHGCDASVAERILAGDDELQSSERADDWLGSGVYFWENNPERALRWAVERAKRPGAQISDPSVIGCVIDLGRCLNLLQADALEKVKNHHEKLRVVHEAQDPPRPMPTNTDEFRRELDCYVFNSLLTDGGASGVGAATYDTVRSLFTEGDFLYEGARIRSQDHIQVCVRTRACIKGCFRPLTDAPPG